MAAELIKAGVPAEQVEAALRADGHEPEAPDARTPEEKDFDEVFAAAAPGEIKPEYLGRIPADAPADSLAIFNAGATAWASAVGFPASIGAAVIERALDVGHAYKPMDEASRQLWLNEQPVLLSRLAGSHAKAQERVTLAVQAMQRGGPEFSSVLHGSGALFDVGIILQLAKVEERQQARRQ